MPKLSGLGRGLDSLFADNTDDIESSVTLKLNEIEPNRIQPRKDFDEGSLAELADSIAQHGIIQPLLVRPILSGGYQIVAGERRWRAARMAGLNEVPVLIREMDDREFMEISLIENLQREDLTPFEEAEGYRALMETYSMTQEEVSKSVGKSRPYIANALRLLALPEKIKKYVNDGRLSSAHGRTLLGIKDENEMLSAAEKAASEQLSVRETEKLVKKINSKAEEPKDGEKPKTGDSNEISHYCEEVRLALTEALGRKVRITGSSGKGELQIEFYGDEDLKNLVSRLNIE